MERMPVASLEAGSITAEEFRTRYFDAGKPVLLRGFIRSWPCASWTPAALAARFGTETIDVMVGSNDARVNGNGPYRTSRTMTLAEFAGQVERGSDEDVYLVAQNQFLRRQAFAALFDDIPCDCNWFDARTKNLRVALWMGPQGAVTPLHFDLQNAILAQPYGRKRVILAAPSETAYLYQGESGYACVDPERPDLQAFPRFREAKLLETALEAGDGLFLPYGWWHHVRSLTASISLSISNFVWDVPLLDGVER